jgi:branched-chain amino acid transport system substrate-binding protein
MPRLDRRSFLAASLATSAAGLLARAARADAGTLKLGHIVDSAGPLKSVAEPSIAAVDIAVDEINAAGGVGGRKLAISRYDSASDPRQAAVAARKLISDDQVLAIIGPFSSGEVAVAVNDAERAHIVMMPAAASLPGLSKGKKYLFRLAQDEGVQFDRMLQTLKQHDIPAKNAGIVYISDEAVDADAGTRVYPQLMDKYGIKHDDVVSITYKTFDVSPQIAKLLQDKPDVVAVAALTDPADKIVHELRRQGFTGRIIGSQLFADPGTGALFGRDGDGVLLMTGFWAKVSPEAESFNQKFIDANAAKGIKKAGAFHTDAQSYDIVHVLAKAMGKAGVTGDPAKLDAEREAIQQAMVGITYTGVLGHDICFDGQDARLPGYAIEIRNSQWNLFESFPAAACSAPA